MLAVVGAAAVVLLAGAPWVLPSAAGEPRGLGEGQAAGKANWGAGDRSPRAPTPTGAGAALQPEDADLVPSFGVAGGWETRQQQKCPSQPGAICPGLTAE